MVNENPDRQNGTRHGKRAKGTVLVSFSCPKALKSDLSEIAAKDDRKLSAWLRRTLQDVARRSRAARKNN